VCHLTLVDLAQTFCNIFASVEFRKNGGGTSCRGSCGSCGRWRWRWRRRWRRRPSCACSGGLVLFDWNTLKIVLLDLSGKVDWGSIL